MEWLTEEEQKAIKVLILTELLNCVKFSIEDKGKFYEKLKNKFDNICNEMNQK